MSAQDLFNRDFRNIIEKMHMTATLTKWYEEHGRHEIFAGGKSVPLKLYAQHVLKEQPTLQIQGLGGKKKASEPQEVLHKPIV